MPIYQLNGNTYALPKDWGTLGLVYIPEAFADAGIDEPTADWTWKTCALLPKPLLKRAIMAASAWALTGRVSCHLRSLWR
jgi:multiple sugar transport system substrate-binding protein